jgi:hypothetical protein
MTWKYWEPWTFRGALTFTRRLEVVLRDVGYHVALGGSALHGGGTGKDLDLIVFPHSTGVPMDEREPALLAALAAFGLELHADVDQMHAHWASYGSTDRKRVRVYAYDDRRVDVMFLE